ncbi:MAG: hypothetical protein LWX11_06595 [Firmicutes bacterium]|nr:hypothetical protein [Bacillota bacterium]
MKALAVSCACLFLAASEPSPLTVPERTAHQRTSTTTEVRAFMAELAQRYSALKPYAPPGAPKEAEGGAPLMAWRLPATGPDPLRVYLNGNIHAGEVEGKEVIQMLTRELLEGRHPELRRHLELVVVPAYNADGTDALDPAIRPWQPNPESGVGRRENARGLDLNRDLMKAAAASTRLFLAIARDFDPHFLMDLHTTNGSYHGFRLTYTPSGALGGDAALSAFNRRMAAEVRERLKTEGLPTYDYGDFMPDEPGRRGGTPERWGEAHPLPRYLVGYQSLRHRVGMLSECYVYQGFPQRIDTTRRFVLACLSWAAGHRAEIKAQIQQAEQRWLKERATLPLNFEPKAQESFDFEVITPIRNAQRQIIGEKARQTLRLPAFTAWKELDQVPLPDGYLIDPIYAEPVRANLEAHGLRVLPGTARPKGRPVLHFTETAREFTAEGYQGVFPLALKGQWKPEPQPKALRLPWKEKDLDRALWVPLDQPLGRLAFYLLDPRSPDGLVYWGFFHSALVRSSQMWGEPPRFPILAVGEAEGAPSPGSGRAPGSKQE